MNPIPYVASILWGVLTGAGLWLLTIPLSLAQMGGPTSWAVPLLVAAGLMLTITLCTARPKGALAGVACGFLFSAPVAGACYLIAHSDGRFLSEFGAELRLVAFATIVVSVLMMGAVAGFRKAPPHSDDQTSEKIF